MFKPMRAIDECLARHLIATFQAGYWELSLRDSISRSPIPHDRQICIYVSQTWYVVPTTVLKIEAHGRIGNSKVNANAHVVKCFDERLIKMIQEESARLGQQIL
jgi:hypothetical protein